MGVSFSDFLRKLNGVVSSPNPLISKELSTELCEIADGCGPQAQYLYHHMVKPGYKVFHDQDNREEEEASVVAGEGFVLRQRDHVVCFNFSREEKLLACHPSNSEREMEVAPTPLRWEQGAKSVCEKKMRSWSFLRQDLPPDEAIALIEKNLNAVSLVEALLPKALPFDASLDKNIRRVHHLLATLLESDKISPDLKRFYSSTIRRRITFYLIHREDIAINDKTFYQSAFNKMLNDFDLFTEGFDTTFGREFYGLLSWKTIGSLLVGFGSHYALFPKIKERIRRREQPLFTIVSKEVKGKARSVTTLASVIVTAVMYLGLSIFTTFFKRAKREDQKLQSCIPPYCPVINREPGK